MVIKKIETRDYLRSFITKANKEAGVIYNASKLNSIKECEDYLLNLVKNLRHKKQDNKAYIKEIDSLKEEIEILNTNNKKLKSERAFYIAQADEAKKAREKAEKDMRIYQNFANEYSKDLKYHLDQIQLILIGGLQNTEDNIYLKQGDNLERMYKII